MPGSLLILARCACSSPKFEMHLEGKKLKEVPIPGSGQPVCAGAEPPASAPNIIMILNNGRRSDTLSAEMWARGSRRMSGRAVAAIVQTAQFCVGDHRTRHPRAHSPDGPPEPPYSEQFAFEGSMEASRDNEDAPEEQHEIPDAKQSQPGLIC